MKKRIIIRSICIAIAANMLLMPKVSKRNVFAATEETEQNTESTEQTTEASEENTESTKQTTETTKQSAKATVRRLKRSGKDLTFKKNVEKGRYLSANTVPENFRLKAGRNSIGLTWKKTSGPANIDGYYILRKNGSSKRYTQIATVSKNKTSYIDKKANKKNKLYTYCMVSYKKDDTIRISSITSDWVSGVTTKSKTVNVNHAVVKNRSEFSTLLTGRSLKIKLSFPKKAANKTIRWTSTNSAVASVNSKGTVIAKKLGQVKIQGKTATGKVISLQIKVVKGGTAESMLNVMRSWLSYSEKNKKHRKIIDIYNTYGKLPIGYKVTYRDAWCDTCISAAAIKSGNVGTIGRECGVIRHIEIFKKKGIWIENGSITPKPGYLIVYNWKKSRQPNNSGGSHIGIVSSVSKGWITTIEGNYKDRVKKRRIRVGWGFIRGYARPKYKK